MDEPIVLHVERRERLDKFVAAALDGVSRSKLAKMMSLGLVLVDGVPQKPSFQVEPGMTVCLERPVDEAPHDLEPAEIPIDVLFEDESLMVVNKPRGLATHPASSLKEPSLVNALLARGGTLSSAGGAFRPGIVHRLDKDTTGILVIAKTDAAHAALARQIETKHADRRYLGVVAGRLDRETFVIDAPIGRDARDRQRMAIVAKGKAAITHVRVLSRLETGTALALKLETGRTHQIRVHLRAIGHPILGDRFYAPKEFQTGPLQLHAAFLRFDHPTSGESLSFFSPPPADFLAKDIGVEALDPWSTD